MLGQTGMPTGAVFLATILAAIIGTLVMGLFANVPYAQAAGMGLNAFFTYTVVFGLGFSWQEALGMVFLCGLINILITVTKVRKMIIKAIPRSLQHAIGAGIGLFIAYIGFKNAGWLSFTADPGTYAIIPGGTVVADSSIIPAITDFANAGSLIALFGIVATIILMLFKVKGGIFIGIIATTLLSLAVGFTSTSGMNISFSVVGTNFKELGDTIGVAVYKGIPQMFSSGEKIAMSLLAIFAF
ncbi:MAG: NCS2 family permease, partial [Syntrophorhabdaceae bacterium]